MKPKCELCGATKNVYVNHYEEHIEPPRVINICSSCHGGIPSHNPHEKEWRKISLLKSTLIATVSIPKSILLELGVRNDEKLEGKWDIKNGDLTLKIRSGY